MRMRAGGGAARGALALALLRRCLLLGPLGLRPAGGQDGEWGLRGTGGGGTP